MIARRAIAGLAAIVLGLSIIAALASADEAELRPIGKIDIDRIQLLYDLCDTYKDSLWPGFDVRDIPIAVNAYDQQELLVNHPEPPDEFRVYEDFEIPGQTLHIREGCTRFGPRSGGWATWVGNAYTAYVATAETVRKTDNWLPLLLHECFHVYQNQLREEADSISPELPELDAEYSAGVGLESMILYAAMTDTTADVRELAEMFVAARERRRSTMDQLQINREGELEFNEGTATYVQNRFYDMTDRAGGIPAPKWFDDPFYHEFDSVGHERFLSLYMVKPIPEQVITFTMPSYSLGMAQCYLLDRFYPGWQARMAQKGSTQFALLVEALAIDDERKADLLEKAQTRFNYDSLYAAQKRLVGKQVTFLEDAIASDGCRYRIYHGAVAGRFKWKPRGPVHRIPTDFIADIDERLAVGDFGTGIDPADGQAPLLWMGGFERFEKGDLLITSDTVPVLYRSSFLEWIDRDPDPDGADCVIEGETGDGTHYTNLSITTDGFRLTAAAARVERSDSVVAIIPTGETADVNDAAEDE